MNRLSRWIVAGSLGLLLAGCASKGVPYRDPQYRYAPDARTPEWLARLGYQDGEAFAAEREVAPGVVHRFRTDATGPLTINSVSIDMTRDDLMLEAEKGQDGLTKRETLAAMSERLADPAARPIALLNADFWRGDSIPVGLFVDEGVIWRGPERGGRSVFAWDEAGNRFIGVPKFDAALVGPGGERLRIDAINTGDDDATVVAYTWPGEDRIPKEGEFHMATLYVAGNKWLPNAPVTVRSAAAMRFIRHEPKSFVYLVSKEPLPEWIESGESTLTATFAQLPGKVVGCTGGGPMLVDSGRNVAVEATERERTGEAFLRTKHPRSAVGLKDGGKTIVFATVDGRQPGRSVGVDLEELANIMIAEGCEIAMNLDGGGSTSVLVRGEFGNFPSDGGGARSVTNALVVRRTAPVGELARVAIEPTNVRAASGALLPLFLKGYDAGGEPVSLEGRNVEWKVEGNGRLRDGMFEAAPGNGNATVTATVKVDGRKTTAVAEFDTEEPAEIAFVPDVLLLESGDEATVRLEARDARGHVLAGVVPAFKIDAPNCVLLATDNAAVGPAAGLMPAKLTATSKCTGEIVAHALGRTAECAVGVDTIVGDTAFTFDALAADDMKAWIKGAVYNVEATEATLETANAKEGSAAWKLHYAMKRGGTTKIELPVDATLPGDPVGVGLWVYGDGNKQWLRGELRDSQNQGYYLNFTESGDGIDWKDEWRFVMVGRHDFVPMGGYASGPKPPFTVKSVYVAQSQEAAKTDGDILLDGLTAVQRP